LAKGFTQEQLVRGLATKGLVSQVEHNRTTPSLPLLRLMADRLGRPLAYFLHEKPSADLNYLRKAAELAIRAKEPERALKLTEEARAAATTANDRADLCRLQGRALYAVGRLSEALTVLQAGAATAPPDDPELNAAIYAEIGLVLGDQEQFNAAVEANLRALRWLDDCKHADLELRARVLTNLAGNCRSLGQAAEAMKYLDEALDVATGAESLLRMANAHMALGVMARELGDSGRAIEHCDRALELHRRLGQDRIANQILNNLGDAHYAAGRPKEARDYQTRCVERARELKDHLAIGVAAGELARYALEEGAARAAIEFARESQAAAELAGDHLHQARSLAFEGRAAEKLGRRTVANRCFRRAFQLLVERQAVAKLAEVCAMYSDLLRRRGQPQKALDFIQMAYARNFERLPSLIGSN
jgi:tetratricopeptide (TPR) repeat protein